jgi:hypothetical protein
MYPALFIWEEPFDNELSATSFKNGAGCIR